MSGEQPAKVMGAAAGLHSDDARRKLLRQPNQGLSSYLTPHHDRAGCGRPLLTHLVAELNRLRRRLSLTIEMIRELEAVREQALEAQHDSASRTVKAALHDPRNWREIRLRPGGEVFYRTFDNRRQIASYLGLAPTLFQSGGMDRDRRINRAGNSRARKTLVQLAWLWLRYQPESSLAAWFRDRVGSLQGRTRRIAIVALARKLLIAIWRFFTLGLAPETGDHRCIEFRRRSISGGSPRSQPSLSLGASDSRVSGGSRQPGSKPRA
jgi:transposase